MNILKYNIKFIGFLFILFGYTSNMMSQINTGELMPDILLDNMTGSQININSMKGKVVLIDFWASWCGPCRKANKKLVKLYKDFKNDNFEIIGISLDIDKQRWLKAVESDKLSYTQLIDAKGFDANTAVKFGVESLPSSFLFNQNGVFVKMNPDESFIKNLLKK